MLTNISKNEWLTRQKCYPPLDQAMLCIALFFWSKFYLIPYSVSSKNDEKQMNLIKLYALFIKVMGAIYMFTNHRGLTTDVAPWPPLQQESGRSHLLPAWWQEGWGLWCGRAPRLHLETPSLDVGPSISRLGRHHGVQSTTSLAHGQNVVWYQHLTVEIGRK